MTSDSGSDYVVGIDFGTLSPRAVMVAVADGREVGSAVHEYTHAVVVDTLPGHPGVRLGPDWASQVPADDIDGLKNAVPAAIVAAGIDASELIGVGIGTDFTACTMLPTTADGTPPCELDEFANRFAGPP